MLVENVHGYIPIALSEASCIIAHLFAELALPCPCPADMVEIAGTAYDGTPARIAINGKEVRFYGSVETIARIRAGYCARYATIRPQGTP